MKSPDSELKYSRLSKVKLAILLIPHSNAECKCIFAEIQKTRTEFRPNLSDKNLELLFIKSNQHGPCY